EQPKKNGNYASGRLSRDRKSSGIFASIARRLVFQSDKAGDGLAWTEWSRGARGMTPREQIEKFGGRLRKRIAGHSLTFRRARAALWMLNRRPAGSDPFS